jgi:hypothetical protein
MTHTAAFYQCPNGRPTGNCIGGASPWLFPYLLPVAPNLPKRYISIQNVSRQPASLTRSQIITIDMRYRVTAAATWLQQSLAILTVLTCDTSCHVME